MSLSDQDRKAYEAYLLAATEAERQEAIKKLIPGSHLYYHLYFIDRFKSVSSKLSEDDTQLLAQFKKKYPHDQYYKQIETQLKFLEYDDATTDEQRSKVLGDLAGTQFLNLQFDHQKPEDLNRGLDSASSQAGEDQDMSEPEEPSEDEENDSEQEARSYGSEQMQNQTNNNNCDFDEMEDIQMDSQNMQRIPRQRNQRIHRQKGKTSEFDYAYYFGKDKIMKAFKGKKNDEYQSKQKLNQLPDGFEHQIDFTTYNIKAVYSWSISKGSGKLADLQNESLYQSLKAYFDLIYEEDKHFVLNQTLLDSLTLQQLDKLSQLHPKIKEDKNFIGSYFQKMFNEELSKENQEVWTNDEKRANLVQLYNYAKSKNMPMGLRSSLLIEILDLGVKLSVYDEELFKEYLQIPLTIQANFFKKKLEARGDNHWNRYINNVQSQQQRDGNWNNSQSTLITQYLEYFCHEKGSLEAFKEDFDSKYLKKIEEKISIYNSDDMTNLNVDLKKYQSISQEVIVRFLEYNQEIFKVEEDVKLSVELKNIQTLYVKIFEFNTETYYKKTLQPFNTGVNLDGLIASIEKNFEYKNPSNKKFIETFTFPELTGKVGLFIVEFIGNGMSSRAIIKKGSLSLIHKPTIAGHLAYVLDENKKICSGPKTGIYFDGNYYPADQEKGGKIFIPYGKSQLTQKTILMNNDFAQLSDFLRLTEDYQFSAWIHVNQESILIGNKAQVLIRPSLLINQRQASVDILKNTKVTLSTLNFIDSIPVTKNYENIKLSNNKELVLDFQVPPFLSSISVTITTELFNVTKQTKETFTESKTFSVQTHQYSNDMNDLYLRKEQGSYYIYLLGKNGEPKPNVNLTLRIGHIQLKMFAEQKNIILTTDKEGKVKLGPLKKVMGLSVASTLFNLERNYFINYESQSLTYPTNVDTVENESLEFPVLFTAKDRKKVSLIRKSQGDDTRGIVLEDLFDKVEFVKQEDKSYNLIRVNGLADGNYILNIKKGYKKIHITVHKGQYWDNDSFILKRNCLFENLAPLKMIKISNVQIEEGKADGTSDVTIKLDDFSKDSRVHAFAYQYEGMLQKSTVIKYKSHLTILQFLSLNKLMRKSYSKTVFPFAQWKNIFMSNRELSDEFRYVFDRKYAERFQGNTLERPRLVLKRTFIQATQINQEVLKTGTAYEQIQVKEQAFISQNIAPMSYMQGKKQDKMQYQNIQQQSYASKSRNYNNYDDDDGSSDGGDYMNANEDVMIRKMEEEGVGEAQEIPGFQNFLKNPPLLELNLIPSNTGEVKFSANLAPFTQLIVLAVDQNSIAQKQIDLHVNPTQKRDLTLNQPLDTTKGYTESRTTVNISQNEVHFIEDITSTEIQLIDDLKKVKGVLDELMKTHGTNYGVFKELSGIFLSWFKYDKEEKNKQYNKNLCHELNIFIYFKDQPYFQSTVKPFLSCKMEKTFIDHYLLESYDKLLPFATLEGIDQLNALEKCLLIDAFQKQGSKEQANRIAQYMKILKDRDEHINVSQQNQVFDTVLNLNMLKISGEDSKDLQSLPPPPGAPHLGLTTTTASLSMLRASAPPQPRFAPQSNRIRLENSYGGYGEECDEAEDDYYMEKECEEVKRPQKEMEKRSRPQMKMKKEKRRASYGSEDEDVFGERKRQKKNIRLQFSEIQTTNEYMETHYFKQTSYSQSSGLIPINSFWVDYANYLANHQEESSLADTQSIRSFLSSNFVRNANNSVSSLLTFALLDLPYDAESHGYKTNEGRGVEITAKNNIILFKKEVREAPLEISNDILVTHRYVEANNSQNSASMPEEFLVNKAYSCEVIMTNVSPQQKDFSMLYQIPQGALPLQTTKYMKSYPQSLSAYTTNKMIFYFYFPKEGDFVHFPSNASKDSKIIARADSHTLRVVNTLSINKKETFKDIIQTGTKDDILEFLKTYNLLKSEKGFTFYDLLWMLKDKVFFKKVIQVLRERFIYDSQVWQYAFYHKDEQQIAREYLMKDRHYNIITYLGASFNSKLLTISREDKEFKHLDYFPMINARAHNVGDVEQWTLNKNVRSTYEQFLQNAIQAKELDIFQKMVFVYNLQLQDRITEALQIFKTIDLGSLNLGSTLQIQYDYMNAYFDFFTGQSEGFKVARAIVRKYEDYPIASWRILFLEILDQLNEYDGEVEEPLDIDAENMTDEQKKQKYKQSIKKEPRLECEVQTEKSQITIEVANIKAISIKFYIIDAEILFSRTPFLKENTEEFSYVKPTHIIEKELTNADLNTSIDTVTYLQTSQKFDLEIPENLKNQNMVIEITGEGKQIFKTYYSTQIKVNVLEAYGELKVTDNEGQALSKVYVKVFAQKKGGSTANPFFFRDGYTDIRGKFEYAQTSGNKLKEVQKFAIFVMSDTLGSIIKECNPPKLDEAAGSSSGDAESQFVQRKQERIFSKIAQSKSKKPYMK